MQDTNNSIHSPEFSQINTLIAIHLFGWKWVKLNPAEFKSTHPKIGYRVLRPLLTETTVTLDSGEEATVTPTWVEASDDLPVWEEFYDVPPFSTDISAAWQVVEKLAELFGCQIAVKILNKHSGKIWNGERWELKKYSATVAGGNLGYDTPDLTSTIYHNEVCMAICLAALAAVGVEVS